MNVLNKISDKLVRKLEKILDDNFIHYFEDDNKRVNCINIHFRDWDEKDNKYNYLIDDLKEENKELKNDFDNYELVYMNYINNPPDSVPQVFHLDYEGTTISYFIPLVDITDENGTEYIKFLDEKDNEKYFEEIKKLSSLRLYKDELIIYLRDELNLELDKDYKIAIVNCNKYELIKMPYYILHRGKKNTSNFNRIMLNIVFSVSKEYDNFVSDKVVKDLELDELQYNDLIIRNRYKVN